MSLENGKPSFSLSLVQYDPKIGKVDENISNLKKILEVGGKRSGNMHFMVFPEMALVGYMWKDEKEVSPYCEEQGKGKSFDFVQWVAKEYRCYVMLGYGEKDGESLYNSAYFVCPEGKLLLNYRKSFLYDTDKTWAKEGPGFVEPIDVQGLKIGFGICMDLNPKDYEAPFDKYEFGNYYREHPCDLVLFCMNWLKNISYEDLLSYWIQRLSPLLSTNTIMALCNRIGTERETQFAGGSSIIQFSTKPRVNYIDSETTGILHREFGNNTDKQ